MQGSPNSGSKNPKPSLKKKSKFSKKIEIPALSFNDIPCPNHPNQSVTHVCTSIFCSLDQMFLCEYCMDLHRMEANYTTNDLEGDPMQNQHIIENIDHFIQRCLTFFPDVIEKERRNKAAAWRDMVKFLRESDRNLNEYITTITGEKKRIEADFVQLRKTAEQIIVQLDESKKSMIKTLNQELIKVQKLLEKLNKLYKPQSEYSKQSESSKLLDEILQLHGNKGVNQAALNEAFLKVRRIFNNRNISFDLDEKSEPHMSQAGSGNDLSEMKALVRQINLKMANPPRYRFYKNSETDYATLELAIQTLANSLKSVDKRLLVVRDQLYLSLGTNEQDKENMMAGELLLIREPENFELKKRKMEIITSLKTEHSKGITSMCYFERDKLITSSWDKTIQVFNIVKFACIKTLICEKTPYILAVSVNKKANKFQIVSGHAEGYLMVINDKFIIRHMFHQHESLISSLVALDDGRTVISGGFDSKIVIYDIIDGLSLKKLSHNDAVNCLDFFGGNRNWIVSGSDDCSVRIWHIIFLEKSPTDQNESTLNALEDGRKPSNRHAGPKDFEIFSESSFPSLERQNTSYDSRAALSEAWRRLWDGRTYQRTNFVKKLEHKSPVKAIKTLKMNQRILLTAEYDIILVWDIETAACLKKIGKHDNQIYKLGVIEMNSAKGIPSNVTSFKSCSELMSEILNNLESPRAKQKQKKQKDGQPHQHLEETHEMELKKDDNEIVFNREKKRSNSAFVKDFGKVKKISALLLLLESPFYIVSFGEDQCIKLWDISQGKCIAETPDQIKELTYQWRYGSALFVKNELDSSVHFLHAGDKDNVINLWRLR